MLGTLAAMAIAVALTAFVFTLLFILGWLACKSHDVKSDEERAYEDAAQEQSIREWKERGERRRNQRNTQADVICCRSPRKMTRSGRTALRDRAKGGGL